MQTNETPFTHVRGTDLVLTGWVYNLGAPKTASNGGAISADTIYFAIAERIDENRQTVMISYSTPGSEISVDAAAAQYTVIVPKNSTKTGVLPKDEYWLQVDLLDAVTGRRACICKGPLELRSSPFGT